MPKRDVRSAEAISGPVEKLVPSSMASVLERNSLCRGACGYIRRLDDAGHPGAARQFVTQACVGVRGRSAQLMIQMRQTDNGERDVLFHFREQAPERNRVPTARHGDGHPRARRDEGVSAERREYPLS